MKKKAYFGDNPTIRDVAKEAQVSTGTISRFLNGHKLKERNMIAIEKAIKKIGFRENMIAKGLKSKKTFSLGVLFSGLGEVFLSSIVKEIESFLGTLNYSVIFANYENRNQLKSKLDFLVDRSVEGIVFFPNGLDFDYSDLISVAGKTPVVITHDNILDLEIDRVFIDNVSASFRATEYLIQKGHRRIGVISGDMNLETTQNRLLGFQKAMRKHKVEIKEHWVVAGDYSIDHGYDASLRLLSAKDAPTAILSFSLDLGTGFLIALHEKQTAMPRDISFVTFDDSDLFRMWKPPVTVIRQPVQKLAERAATLLLRRIVDSTENNPELQLIETDFVERESVRTV